MIIRLALNSLRSACLCYLTADLKCTPPCLAIFLTFDEPKHPSMLLPMISCELTGLYIMRCFRSYFETVSNLICILTNNVCDYCM